MPRPRTPRVFVNYRTADTGPVVSRLFALFEQTLTSGQVFVDRERIERGSDWVDHLRYEVNECTVFLAVIGKHWLRVRNENDQRRIDDDGDWVRNEIEFALERAETDGLVLIPVLVDVEHMPPGEALPPSIRGLVRKQAARIHTGPEAEWRHTSEQLLETLVGHGISLAVEPKPVPSPEAEPLSQLSLLVRRRMDLSESGEPTAHLDSQIRDLKRNLLAGPTLPAGYVLGQRFELRERLGHGGFGVVWRAWDQLTNLFVAIKVLHAQFSEDAERRDRFFRGAKKMSRLDHPAIVRIVHLPAEAEDGYWWFAMEFVPGGDLRRAVYDKSLDHDQVFRVLADIAEALEYAWDKAKVIHRDVKPTNVLLTKDGRGKLTDFDLVKAPDTTQLTVAVGDFDFGAPEVMRIDGSPTRASDVYSLAATAIFALTGGYVGPRQTTGQDKAIAKSELTDDQLRLIHRALSKDPASRPQSPRTLIEDLAHSRTTTHNHAPRRRDRITETGTNPTGNTTKWWHFQWARRPRAEPDSPPTPTLKALTGHDIPRISRREINELIPDSFDRSVLIDCWSSKMTPDSIANKHGVSRQAVVDSIERTTRTILRALFDRDFGPG